jgi:hypothetical protein
MHSGNSRKRWERGRKIEGWGEEETEKHFKKIIAENVKQSIKHQKLKSKS